MAKFSKSSLTKLNSCDQRLVRLFQEVIKHHDCTVLEGFRSREKQDEYYRTGKSKLRFPHSKHNRLPSRAVDVVCYPIDWNNRNRFYFFAGLVKGIAAAQGLRIRWGGDWDSDNDFKDQSFHDLPHFEILE